MEIFSLRTALTDWASACAVYGTSYRRTISLPIDSSIWAETGT